MTGVRAVVITVSTKGAAGERADESGPAMRDGLAAAGHEVIGATLVSDDAGKIANAILDGVRKGILGAERRLDQELRLTMNGFPARQLLVTDGKARQGLRVRIALAGRRLYQAIYVGAAGQEKGEDARRFTDSFALEAR